MSIESITATIPVSGQSYTDLRPTISASSIDEYREQLAEVGRLAGNDAFVKRMEQNKSGKEKIIAQGATLYFDKEAHIYEDESGVPYLTGSAFAEQFGEPFKRDLIAPKVAEKRLTTVERVLEGWEMKSEASTMFGSALHKALECAIKYDEMPNHPLFAGLAKDFLDINHEYELASEQFIVSPEEHLCGTIDVLVNLGDKRVKIIDFKTGDVTKKVALTARAKELWPDLASTRLGIYRLQLSFYAHILKGMGYKVEGIEVYAETNGEWQVYILETLDIKKALC